MNRAETLSTPTQAKAKEPGVFRRGVTAFVHYPKLAYGRFWERTSLLTSYTASTISGAAAISGNKPLQSFAFGLALGCIGMYAWGGLWEEEGLEQKEQYQQKQAEHRGQAPQPPTPLNQGPRGTRR